MGEDELKERVALSRETGESAVVGAVRAAELRIALIRGISIY